MNSRTARTLATGLALWSVMASVALAQRRSPTLISPDGRDEESQVATGCPTFSWTLVGAAAGEGRGGGGEGESRVAAGCPTFSWTLVAEATGYELRVYEAGPREETQTPPAAPRM